MKALEKQRCITVTELKRLIENWPEKDQYGDPTEVWVETGWCLSSPCTSIFPLNMRENEKGEKWSDIIFGCAQYDKPTTDNQIQ